METTDSMETRTISRTTVTVMEFNTGAARYDVRATASGGDVTAVTAGVNRRLDDGTVEYTGQLGYSGGSITLGTAGFPADAPIGTYIDEFRRIIEYCADNTTA
ncbi:MAG: hypothetical protein NC117_02735 [Pseudoflavonifractor sp.]|nr:hypothetical protein [Pseudoflavonifractor sp.]